MMLGPAKQGWRLLAAGWVVFGLAVVATVRAQGPDMRSRFGEFNPAEMIGRLDTNGNGQLDPDEMQGRARFFIERFATAANLDLTKPVPLDKLKAAIAQQMSGGPGGPPSSTPGSPTPPSTSSKPAAQPSIAERMAFGVKDTRPPVPGFGDPAQGPSVESLTVKYDAEVMRRVKERFDEYDRNQDGYIDSEEWQRGRWDPPAAERDKNKDGRLTREELAEHYANRQRGGSSSGRGGPPGGGGPSTGGPPGGGSPFGGSFGGGGPPSGGSSSSSTTTSTSSSPASISDRTIAYADGLMKSYDENKDGILQKTEWSRMKGDYSAADKNGDGNITKDELLERLASQGRGGSSGSSGSKSSASRKTYRFLPPAERLPKGLPSWFGDKDKNGDGQVMMSEYASSWTTSSTAEFTKLDQNGDGVITAREALAGSEKKDK